MTDSNLSSNKPSKARFTNVLAIVGGVVILLVIIAVKSGRFAARTGWPWWIIPLGVVVGLAIIVGILLLSDRKVTNVHKLVAEKRPGMPTVPGFTTAEMADWPQKLPHGIPVSKDFGAFVVVVNTPAAYEVWTTMFSAGPSWTISKTPQTVVVTQPGTLMGSQSQSIIISDGVWGGGAPDLNFIPSYSGNQTDAQLGSPESISRALADLGAAPSAPGW